MQNRNIKTMQQSLLITGLSTVGYIATDLAEMYGADRDTVRNVKTGFASGIGAGLFGFSFGLLRFWRGNRNRVAEEPMQQINLDNFAQGEINAPQIQNEPHINLENVNMQEYHIGFGDHIQIDRQEHQSHLSLEYQRSEARSNDDHHFSIEESKRRIKTESNEISK